MKLSIKLILLSVILSSFAVITGALSLIEMNSINQNTQEIIKNWLPSIKIIGEINTRINSYRRYELARMVVNGEQEKQYYTSLIQQNTKDINAAIDKYKGLISEPEEKEAFNHFLQVWTDYVTAQTKVEELLVANKVDEAHPQVTVNSLKIYNEASNTLAKLITINDTGSIISSNLAEQAAIKGKTFVIVLLTCSMIVAAIISFFIIRSVKRQLGEDPNYLYYIATEIADGNLDLTFKSVDTAGGVYSVLIKMVSNLKEKIREAEDKSNQAKAEASSAKKATQLAEEATKHAELAKSEGMIEAANRLESIVSVLNVASESLSAQIEQSSRGAEEQSSRVRETATAMEEMNATVLEVARNAQQAATASTQTKDLAEQGNVVVNTTVSAIDNIKQQSSVIKQDMDILGKQADEINQIIDVISDIADQTNLLALNAAIEAARAGDAGRGFAVVADEVRKLAEKTMTATKEVNSSINAIQQSTRKNIVNVDEIASAIDKTANYSNESGKALTSILQYTHDVNTQIQSIATASEEQSAASEEISHAIEQVANISEETSTSMGHASKAVSELLTQSHELQRLIKELKG